MEPGGEVDHWYNLPRRSGTERLVSSHEARVVGFIHSFAGQFQVAVAYGIASKVVLLSSELYAKR